MSLTEAQLDAALAKGLAANVQFSQWFFAQTRFAGQSAKCVFCRSDNPWSKVLLEVPHPTSGEIQALDKECETDVLAVYESAAGTRFALHIENKLANGRFTENQPELYRERLSQWKGRKKLGEYSDATSVLVAPREFFERHRAKAEMFESFVPHESIALYLQEFRQEASADV
jgi:hypothetical protein